MTTTEALERAYCWLVYFAHHEDGSLTCAGRSDGLRCPHCAAKAAADALWAPKAPTSRYAEFPG